MNRRELFERMTAIGLTLPVLEPLRRYWNLDGSMIPHPIDAAPPTTGIYTTRQVTMSTYARTAGPRNLPGWVRRPDLDPVDGLRWMWSRDVPFIDGRRAEEAGFSGQDLREIDEWAGFAGHH